MAKINSEFRTADNTVRVTILENHLGTIDGYYGRIERNRINIDNIIKEITDSSSKHSEYELKEFASMIKNRVLSHIEAGDSIDLMDLGVLYPAFQTGMRERPKTVGDLPQFDLRFTPSDDSAKAVSKINVTTIVFSDSNPMIQKVETLWGGGIENVLKAGKVTRISGKKLKLDVDEKLYLVPIENDKPCGEEKWIVIEDNDIAKNQPSSIEFYTPMYIEAGQKYQIAVKAKSETIYSNTVVVQ